MVTHLEHQCQECGQYLEKANTYHTHESCLLFKLNSYRQAIGKKPIEIDLEAEDTK